MVLVPVRVPVPVPIPVPVPVPVPVYRNDCEMTHFFYSMRQIESKTNSSRKLNSKH